MVTVPSFLPALSPVSIGTIFTIGRDEPAPADPAQQVRSYMNRPRNVLFTAVPDPAKDASEEQGGFIVDEAAPELVFPLKCGILLPDNNVIPTTDTATVPVSSTQPPEVAPTAAAQVTDLALAPATPKKVVKQHPSIPSSSLQQWPNRQSIIPVVAAAAVAEVGRLLSAGNLESNMQQQPKGTQNVLATLPEKISCGNACLLTQRVLDCDRSAADKPYSNAIWQMLGESIEQRVAGVPFDLWIDFRRGKGCVQVQAKVMWGPQ